MSHLNFLRCIARWASALPVLLMLNLAHASENFPSASVKIVVPFAAGGGTDTIARAVAHALNGSFPQPVVIENKGGAGGSIGTLAVTSAPPDGHTLLLGSNGTMVLNPILYPHLRYQVDRDLVPVAGIASLPYLIAANPKFPAQDLKGLISFAKSRRVTFANPGNGTTSHLVGVLLESMSGADITHVPYKGAAPAMNDVIAGTVDLLSGDLGTLMPMIQSGKLRPLAVTSAKRTSILPNVPAVAELIPGFEATGWFGIFAPKATPANVVEKLSSEFLRAGRDPKVQQKLHELGGVPLQSNSDQLRKLISAESGKWQKVIQDNKVTADMLQ